MACEKRWVSLCCVIVIVESWCGHLVRQNKHTTKTHYKCYMCMFRILLCTCTQSCTEYFIFPMQIHVISMWSSEGNEIFITIKRFIPEF